MTLYESYQIKFCGHTELAMNIAKCDENCSFFVKDSRQCWRQETYREKLPPCAPPPLEEKLPSFMQNAIFFTIFWLFGKIFASSPVGVVPHQHHPGEGGIVPPHENLLAGKPQLICPSLV